ncbi:Cell division cycle 5-like protein [Hordeum vulgare]|nr:Cell division cycle 5-like protein [Hordeum vulgare]
MGRPCPLPSSRFTGFPDPPIHRGRRATTGNGVEPVREVLLEDSSDLDDSDVETMLLTLRQQSLVMALAVKEHEDENRKRRRGSTVDRLCITRNRHLGNEMLMQDYLAANPTYPPHLFSRTSDLRDPTLCAPASSQKTLFL